uniref:Ig-like domain-containing protein n=1 Tax=Poecilia latipinna TaxID=48699 RepID=A0A3B3TTV3_9TELE
MGLTLVCFKTNLTCFCLITVNVSQGKDAILPCSPTTKENLSFKSFKWRKDGQNVFYYDAGNHYNDGLDGQGPQFKGRVLFFQDQLRSGDASIQIQTVTIQDSGIYSCEISGLNSGIQTFNIKLVVGKYLTFVIISKDKNQLFVLLIFIFFMIHFIFISVLILNVDFPLTH